MVSAELLALLCCPETRQPLRVATEQELARSQLTAGLVREDGHVLYPIRDGIPMLLADAAVRLDG